MLLLSAALVPSPAQAESGVLEWTSVDKPGMTGNIVVSPSEVSEIAIGSNGVLYAIDSENAPAPKLPKVYRSLDAGVTWEDITLYLVNDGAELPATKIAVAPDKPGIVAVVTNDGTGVYLSTDGGITWTDTGVPGLVVDTIQTTIQAIAISKEYIQDNKSYREIAIGTAFWGDGDTTGQVWVRQFGGYGTSWQNQKLTVDPSRTGDEATGSEVSALAYSPKYPDDATLLVVASTSGDVAGYENQTLLCLHNTSGWNNLPGYPAKIASAGDGLGVSYIHSSLALPSDYDGDDASKRQLFVSYDLNLKPANPDDPDLDDLDANDDVYRLDDPTSIHPFCRLKANIDNPGDPINICGIAYHGTTIKGELLAGDACPVPGSLTVQVRRTEEPFDASPIWHLSTVPPTGPGNAKVGWSSDGEMAYCGTGALPGAELDESAFSASLDGGDKWRQMGLMDTIIKLADIVPAPDGESLFVTTSSQYGPEGIWRTAGDPLGERWERLLTIDTCCDAVILRFSLNYDDDYTMYAAEAGGSQLAVSHNRGNSWQWCRFPPGGCPGGPIIDIVVAAEDTVYAALPEGCVAKTTTGGSTWWDLIDTGLPDINMLAIADAETIFVGGRNGDVAYSTDGGESFTLISEVIASGSGDVQVVADTNYQENGTIYAANNLPDEGIWRWVIGTSTEWEQIDESITELEKRQRIGGLTMGPEGTLYALRIEPASSTSGGVTRSLNPLAPDPADVEFDLVNDALPAGAIFGPTPAFPNTLSCLKLSGDAKQNELWTIDTSDQIIYRFQDTLATPVILVSPSDGAKLTTTTKATLEWEALCDAESYQIELYRYCPECPDEQVFVELPYVCYPCEHICTGCSGETCCEVVSDLVDLDPGTMYFWRVRVCKGHPVLSKWSELVEFTTALGKVPYLCSPWCGQEDIILTTNFSWDEVPGATGYEVQIATNEDFSPIIAEGTPTVNAWAAAPELDYSTTYYWRVRAISATSYSAWGTSVFTTEAAPSAPLPRQSSPPPLAPEPTPTIPSYLLGVLIGIGVILVVALLVFIVRTRR